VDRAGTVDAAGSKDGAGSVDGAGTVDGATTPSNKLRTSLVAATHSLIDLIRLKDVVI
jgi:hypothetical protein